MGDAGADDDAGSDCRLRFRLEAVSVIVIEGADAAEGAASDCRWRFPGEAVPVLVDEGADAAEGALLGDDVDGGRVGNDGEDDDVADTAFFCLLFWPTLDWPTSAVYLNLRASDSLKSRRSWT